MCTTTLALVLLPLVLAISIDDILPRGEANCPGLNSSVIVSDAEVPSGFCPFIFATGLGSPRGILVVDNGDVLLVEQDYARVTVLYDEDRDGQSSSWERAILAEATGLNHGLAVNGGYLYASSSTQVFRWSYTPGDRQTLENRTLVVDNIPCCHHVTRTLVFDTNGTLYVQSGSGSNVDPDPTHSEIRTFNVLGAIPDGGIQWNQGVLYASGLRNEVGLRFDDIGRLWGVENGCDDLNRPDLGGDIHDNNPSEEMNLFFGPGLFYGYPYCWSEFDLPLNNSHPIGTQWVHPNFMNSTEFSDNWCQNPNNVIPPAYNFQAHMAPMDIIFDIPSSFSLPYGAFVSFHGSWDRPVPVGYRVDYVLFDQEGLFPQANKPIFQHAGDTASWEYRPVGLAWSQNCFFGDCLLITDDQSGTVLALANPGN